MVAVVAGGLVTITHERYEKLLDAAACDVVAVGDYYSRRRVMLEPLQRIGAAHDADWQAALAAFHAARQRATH